ncbi:hypothetical protein ASG40_11490 [Methylobacterium sp. Leaf399]|nr:hypothetical protein ASG40_11490 [Methylobacterium sp. Leaf399]
MKVQRDCALALCASLMRKLGMIPVEVTPQFELDHVPALALREIDPVTGQHRPHQHDPAHLVWMRKEAHAAKTFGTGATTRGADAGDIAHNRRLTAKEEAFRSRLLAKTTGAPLPPVKPKHRFPPGRKLPSSKNIGARP